MRRVNEDSSFLRLRLEACSRALQSMSCANNPGPQPCTPCTLHCSSHNGWFTGHLSQGGCQMGAAYAAAYMMGFLCVNALLRNAGALSWWAMPLWSWRTCLHVKCTPPYAARDQCPEGVHCHLTSFCAPSSSLLSVIMVLRADRRARSAAHRQN
jgi:hypothetical protein